MKTVLITGASRGIGSAAAIKFAKEGFAVAINYNKSHSAAETLKKELETMGARTEIFCADIGDNEQTLKMIDDIKEKFGKIDVLINNAGVALTQGLLTDFSDADIRDVFNINVVGMINCTRLVVPYMVQQKSGVIINVSSIWGVLGASCEVIYSASKAAIIGFTKALAKELGPSGIRVNCVAPGFIDTDMNAHLSLKDKKEFAEDTALGRIGNPDEVADVIYFLATDSSSYITGQTIAIDGGI